MALEALNLDDFDTPGKVAELSNVDEEFAEVCESFRICIIILQLLGSEKTATAFTRSERSTSPSKASASC